MRNVERPAESDSKVSNLHPQKTRLVFHVGITGHRPPRLADAAVPVLKESIRSILLNLEAGLSQLGAIKDQVSSPDPLIRVISSLAEGADRVAAHVALKFKTMEIQCPLPFHKEEYEKGFGSAESRAEFNRLLKNERTTAVMELNGSPEDKDGAYLEAGRVMLEQSDILIAVWDGKPSAGRGGTDAIIAEARSTGKFVLHVQSNDPTNIRPLGVGDALTWNEALQRELEKLLVWESEPIKGDNGAEANEQAKLEDEKARQRYFGEEMSCFNAAWLFTAFRNLVRLWGNHTDSQNKRVRQCWPLKDVFKWVHSSAYRRPNPIEETAKGWDLDWQNNSDLPHGVEKMMNRAFGEHYAWADGLASHYAGLYRSAYILRYLLVTAAVLYTAFGFYWPDEGIRWFGFAGQVGFLGAVCLLIKHENKKEWHRRSLEYRRLAEQLRVCRFLFPLGQGPSIFTCSGAGINEIAPWVKRYLRSILRQAGLVNTVITADYIPAYRSYLKEAEVKPQINYHREVSEWQDCLQRRLSKSSELFFYLGVAAFGIRVLTYTEYWPQSWNPTVNWIKAASIIFPALGVTLFAGIRSHGEFNRLAQRSAGMCRFHKKLEHLLDSEPEASWSDCVQITRHLASAMQNETADWRTVVAGRSLSLPV